MINIEILRENPQIFRDLIAKGRGNPEKADVNKWLELDAKKSNLELKLQHLLEERNQLAKQKTATDRGIQIKQEIKAIEEPLREITAQWQEILDWIPNIPIEMPDGKGEPDNIVLKAWRPDTGYVQEAVGKKARNFTEKLMPQYPAHATTKFTPLHHLDLGTKLGIIDQLQSAKVSGSRFTYLLGDIVLLQYAIQQLVFTELIKKGFKPIVPPILTKEIALYGTSHFPEQKDQVYAIKSDYVEDKNQLFLLGSTEPANFAFFMDKVIPEEELPIKLFAYSPAFRTEVGSWGKDVRGIKRLHQFEKIEINAVCLPEQSEQSFDEFLAFNEWFLQTLELPYQLALKCKGDAGYMASAKQVDPEYWTPVQKEWMEMGSDTNATDYQARRFNIKIKRKSGKREYAHTVNDTGVSMGRALIAILENYQQEDGSVLVPKALQKFVGKERIG